jgi:hypothetical protein
MSETGESRSPPRSTYLPEHTSDVTVRDWLPSRSQVSLKPPHSLHPLELVPQAIPSVPRPHVCVWTLEEPTPEHVPPEHTSDVTVRDWVALLSQISVKPLQALHPPALVPQPTPSVSRPQLCVSVVVEARQLPLKQAYSVMLRD